MSGTPQTDDALLGVEEYARLPADGVRTELVRGPDVSVIRRDRLPDPHHPGFLRGAPELPIEIVSPSNTAAEVQEKVREYLAAGARAVWVLYPQTRTVAVHASPRTATFLGEADLLDGGDTVPGLRVAVAAVFAE